MARDSVSFSMEAGGSKYLLSVVGFRIRGNELVASFQLDHAFAVHTSVYFFKSQIMMEYSSIPVGEFQLPIRPPEAAINYLQSLANRRFAMSFGVTELILEEMGQFKSLWLGNSRGLWIDVKSLPLIQRLQQKSLESDENIVKMAEQIETLESDVMKGKPEVVTSEELDQGKTADEILVKKKEERAEESTEIKEPMFSSTRIDGPRQEDSQEESDRKVDILNSIHRRQAPFAIPVDEEIVDMFEKIQAVGDKFGKEDKSDPQVLAKILVTVEALTSVIKEKCEAVDTLDLGEEDEKRGSKRHPRSVDELALGLQKRMEGRDVRKQRALKKTNEIKDDWMKSGLQDDMGRLWGMEDTDHWGSTDHW